MVDITNDPQQLAQWVTNRGEGLVVFDGPARIGKASLMRDIATRLEKSAAIDVDDFLERRDVFISAIRFDELREKVSGALENHQFVLMASVCARKVVDLLELAKAVFVYVWPYDEPRSSEALAEDYSEAESHHPLEREVKEYHQDYRPSRNADVRYILKVRETRKVN